MANAFYTSFKTKLGSPGTLGATSGDAVDLLDDTIKVALIDTGSYTYSAAHEYYSSLAGVVGTPTALASKTLTGATFDAADTTLSAVTGNQSEALVLYKDTGNAATSPLICYLDTGVTNLPVTPNGGDIKVQWPETGIFVL